MHQAAKQREKTKLCSRRKGNELQGWVGGRREGGGGTGSCQIWEGAGAWKEPEGLLRRTHPRSLVSGEARKALPGGSPPPVSLVLSPQPCGCCRYSGILKV